MDMRFSAGDGGDDGIFWNEIVLKVAQANEYIESH